jgi:hypothetical protein
MPSGGTPARAAGSANSAKGFVMINVRHDKIREAEVNKALAAALLIDMSAGVWIMTHAGFPPEDITRVLHHPDQRRATDWQQ